MHCKKKKRGKEKDWGRKTLRPQKVNHVIARDHCTQNCTFFFKSFGQKSVLLVLLTSSYPPSCLEKLTQTEHSKLGDNCKPLL